ncbi:MAG: hypothetical protein ACLFUC_04640 [Bacteroidales bacterium]
MKYLQLIILWLFVHCFSFAQESQPALRGQPVIKVFSNFYTGLTGSDNSSAFEIRRAYLGYKQELSENFQAVVKLDIGSPDDQSEFSRLRRYAYFKNAGLRYQKKDLTLWFGLIDLLQYDIQEEYWGHRYILKSFQDEYDFGPSADIGGIIAYTLTDNVSADFTFVNGEGYKSLQSDRSYKSATGITVHFMKNYVARAYLDYTNKEFPQITLAGFFGANFNNIFIGGIEYNYKINEDYLKSHDMNGFSAYGSYNFPKDFQLFVRYDFLVSNILPEETAPWNLEEDGSSVIAGIQYKPAKRIKTAINYQDWFPYAGNLHNRSFIYLNVEFKY